MDKFKICEKCNKSKKVLQYSTILQQYICKPCYKKYIWKPKLIECKRCGRMLPNHAKGFCAGCYNSTFHIERVKIDNAKRVHNISEELYKKLIEKCIICGFDKVVDIHHLDHSHQNSSESNLVGLCPNHHRMLHHRKYQKEIFDILRGKGFKIPEKSYKTEDFVKISRS